MSVREKPSPENSFLIAHAQLLADSYKRQTKKELLGECAREDLARELFEAPFGLVSHGTDSNPVFNYGNSTALAAFEMEWADFVRLASRDSAEVANQEEREQLMTKVKRDGYIDNYRGIRISAKGRRFCIEQATIWNVIDGAGIYCGQAAVFFLEE